MGEGRIKSFNTTCAVGGCGRPARILTDANRNTFKSFRPAPGPGPASRARTTIHGPAGRTATPRGRTRTTPDAAAHPATHTSGARRNRDGPGKRNGARKPYASPGYDVKKKRRVEPDERTPHDKNTAYANSRTRCAQVATGTATRVGARTPRAYRFRSTPPDTHADHARPHAPTTSALSDLVHLWCTTL